MATSVQDWLAQFEGTLQGVVLACTSMIATHPEKEKILSLLNALIQQSAPSPDDNSQIQNYKLGIRKVVEQISKGVETALLADQIRELKNESGSH